MSCQPIQRRVIETAWSMFKERKEQEMVPLSSSEDSQEEEEEQQRGREKSQEHQGLLQTYSPGREVHV